MSNLLHISPELALLWLVSKHYVALVDFVDDLSIGIHQPYERWDEKIGDIMAYMVLLDAMRRESVLNL